MFTIKRQSFRVVSIATLFAIIFYFILFILSDVEKAIPLFFKLSNLFWFQIVALVLLGYFFRCIRWVYFGRIVNIKISLFDNIVIYFSAFSLTLTPGKSGELIRSIFLAKYKVDYPCSISMFISERLMDLIAVSFLSLFFLLVYFSIFDSKSVLIIFAFVFFIYICFRLFLKFYRKGIRFNFIARIYNTIGSIKLLLCMKHFPFVFLLSVIAWGSQGLSMYLICKEMGYSVSLWLCISLYSVSILIGAASFVPAGIGVTELAIVTLLMDVGFNQSDALIASIVSRGVTLWFAVLVGVIAMCLISVKERSFVFDLKN